MEKRKVASISDASISSDPVQADMGFNPILASRSYFQREMVPGSKYFRLRGNISRS